MNVVIAFYSETGHTEEAARRLAAHLSGAGHEVGIEPILQRKPAKPGLAENANAALREFDVAACDAIVLATPVQAFSMPPAMARWLSGLSGLSGKKAAFLVTKRLPWNWTGASRVLGALRRAAEAAGAESGAGAVVHWKDAADESELAAASDAIGRFLGRAG